MFHSRFEEEIHQLPGARGPLQRLSGMQLFALSFLGLIALGTAGFLALPGLYTGPRLGFVDALFTATSAVCVTGLIVVDTATYFTPRGQAWILFLIQAGGLGILTFTTLFVLALGRRSPLGLEEAAGGAQAAVLRHVQTRHLVRSIFLVTFTLEAMGGLLLWLAWIDDLGAGGAVWPALFHAISAFCNAGFSTFSDSLVGFRESPLTVGTVSLLVIVGGLGFVVVEDLRARYLRRTERRISLHSKLVLSVTGLLLVMGWGLFGFFEWDHTLGGMGVLDRLTNAGFMSVTPRTAGFNTVDYAEVTNPSLFLTILLMLVGGSPGSTAGGFKTVTLGVLLLLLWSRLRGEDRVSAFHRTLPAETVQRAAGLVMGGLLVLGSSVFLLTVFEAPGAFIGDRADFVRLVFEAHSAFGTVGLSMGATPELTTPDRLIVTALMFLGRVGPAAVVAAMARSLQARKVEYRYGEEDVVLG